MHSATLLTAIGLFAQTQEQPARAVSDPGIVTTRQQITPAGVQSVFEGRVYGVSFGATPSELWVLNATSVYKMDWRENRVLNRAPVQGTPGLQGIRFAEGKAWVSATGAGRKVRLFSVNEQVTSIAEGLGSHIAGALAVSGSTIVVPLIYDNKLAVIRDGKVAGAVATGIAPFGAVTNGAAAYVTNWGGRVPSPKDLTARTGLQPTADRVVVDARGIASTGTVTRIDLEKMAATHTIPVELHPAGIVWDEPRKRLYVANGNKDSVSVIDTGQNRVVKTFEVQPFGAKVSGIAPAALAISPDGQKLYVACGGINAVVVMNASEGGVEGAIPTAWYPSGLAISADGKHLAISALLGAGSGWRDAPAKRFVHSYRGAVSVVEVPDRAQLASYTTAVVENNRMGAMQAKRTPSNKPAPVPERAGDPSTIEHVVYIIKENRTYDQVFGDMRKGNGDATLVMFGKDVTPNQHRLADQFVLLDNFYATGGNSGDGHQWVTQANETAYALWPGYAGRSYPFDGTDPIAYSSSGFIWDLALQRRKTVRVYGEFAGRLAEPRQLRAELLTRWKKGDDFSNEWNTTAAIAPLNNILAKNYPPYATSIPDVIRAQLFLADVKKWSAEGAMPNLVIVQLPSNHTFGTTPDVSTPRAMVADNDFALGRIVEGLTKTKFWPKMAIFVVEDDAQNGVDHVDGHRTVALAISPYTRRGHVDSTFYSHQSILKTIELILGLPTLSLFDLIANDMRASFTEIADISGYEAVAPDVPLDEKNPPLKAISGEERRAALDSLKMRWDVPDAAPSDRLNRILWHSIRGWRTPYPRVRQAVFAPLSLETEDDDR